MTLVPAPALVLLLVVSLAAKLTLGAVVTGTCSSSTATEFTVSDETAIRNAFACANARSALVRINIDSHIVFQDTWDGHSCLFVEDGTKVVVAGVASSRVVLQPPAGARILRVLESNQTEVYLQDLVFDSGDRPSAMGGAIHSRGRYLELTRCTLSRNAAQRYGGAIMNDAGDSFGGDLVLNECHFNVRFPDIFLPLFFSQLTHPTLTHKQSNSISGDYAGAVYNYGGGAVS